MRFDEECVRWQWEADQSEHYSTTALAVVRWRLLCCVRSEGGGAVHQGNVLQRVSVTETEAQDAIEGCAAPRWIVPPNVERSAHGP